jgi:hypothetical protein
MDPRVFSATVDYSVGELTICIAHTDPISSQGVQRGHRNEAVLTTTNLDTQSFGGLFTLCTPDETRSRG